MYFGVKIMVPLSQPCLLATHKISKIAAPLFKATGLNFFSYARDFDTNKSFSLQTDIEMYLAWYDTKSPYCSSVIPNGIYTAESIQNAQLQSRAKELNYSNTIHIFRKNADYSEIITFAAPSNSMNVMQFYVNNMGLFNRFLMYFKDKATDLIAEATRDPIIVPDFMLQPTNPFIANLDRATFDEETRVSTFYFEDDFGVKLSKRELECLNYYIKGLSTSQIATLMNVKKITADTFMKNVKHKFNCGSKTELFEKLWNLGIIQSNGVLA